MTPRPGEPSELFRAFADATRLRLLSLLLERDEICVCDLCEVLDEIQPKVSRHLAILRRAGLVEVRSAGKWKYYKLAAPPSALHAGLLRCLGGCFGDFGELARDRARLRRIARRSDCATPARGVRKTPRAGPTRAGSGRQAP